MAKNYLISGPFCKTQQKRKSGTLPGSVLREDHAECDILREDSYFVATDDVGIKLRGGNALEIKVRLRRKKRGTEYWVYSSLIYYKYIL